MKIFFVVVCLCLCGCATVQKPGAPGAAYVATSTARLQVAKARVELAKIPLPEAVAALDRADAALEVAAEQIERLQADCAALASSQVAAREARDYWRRQVVYLAFVAGVLLLWTFRKFLL